MAVSPYYSTAVQLFEQSEVIRQGGFVVEASGKGTDFNDLLQVKKPAWRLMAKDGEPIGYEGIEVHYESCRPGHWVIHCELWPRQGKKEKAQVLGVTDLLTLKGEITRLIRELGREAGWEAGHGAHLRRARQDPADPSSLIVYTFNLRLREEHSPSEFVSKAIRVIADTAPTIDDILIETTRK